MDTGKRLRFTSISMFSQHIPLPAGFLSKSFNAPRPAAASLCSAVPALGRPVRASQGRGARMPAAGPGGRGRTKDSWPTGAAHRRRRKLSPRCYSEFPRGRDPSAAADKAAPGEQRASTQTAAGTALAGQRGAPSVRTKRRTAPDRKSVV